VRRAIAIVLVLQAVALAGGLGLVRAGKSCCCATKSGAACPMRAHCDAGKCSLRSAASPAVEEQRIAAVIETAFRLEPRRGARGDVWSAPRSPIAHATPPELPPPRRV
jgi:hypothetical protein